MKALSSLLLVLAICVATVIPSGAADDKQLKNTRGDVTYQQGTGAAKPVAVNATVSLTNNDYANTGANSQATITLPDSSQVLIGQLTKIQMLAFDQQPGLATASFFLYQGKTRFAVKHPGGAKANYTFQTSTGQIAVRGTEGDISLDASTLQVNVYALGDPNLPVEVTLNNGKKYKLGAGQALVVGITGAVIAAAAVSSLSSTMTSTFAEFGPANAGAGAAGAGAAGAGAGAAGAAAGVAPAAIAAGAAAVAAGAVVAGATHNSPAPSHTPKPTPSPTAKPTAKPTASPTASPTPVPGSVVVSSLSTFTTAGASQNLTASQSNNNGAGFTISDVTGGAVTVDPSSATDGKFVVKSTAAGGTGSFKVNGAGGKSATVTVTARGPIGLTPLQNFAGTNKSQSATASEYGFAGQFIASVNPTDLLVITGASPTFHLAGNTGGSGTLSITDGTSTPYNVGVLVALGIQGLPSTISVIAGGPTFQFTASEKGATTISASISPAKIASLNKPSGPASGALFEVTGLASGSATLVVSDGLGNSNTIPVTVTSSPSPAPSTTCVPIIIHARHHGGADAAAASPCPTTSPTSSPTARKTSAPLPHPIHQVGGLPPTQPVKKPIKPDPRHLPGSPMHPMQPLTGPQGLLTPPPLPIPPGGGSPP